MNKISILISVYKSEMPECLDASLKSVLEDQTLLPYEIVLIEDGPLNDKLLAVIDKWRNRFKGRFVVIRNEENIGLTRSLNKGISHVTGDLIARMDSDDISHPERFAKQVKYLQEHLDIAVVGGSLQEFRAPMELLDIRSYPLTNEGIVSKIHRACPLAHPSVLMRSSIFSTGIRYDERYRTSQDIALWFTLLKNGYRLANIEDVVLYFRYNDNIYQRRGREKAVNEFKIYMSGIKSLYGILSWRYIFPICRLVSRMLPPSVIEYIYKSPIRKWVIK
ncbi:MAG: glycosyltransferase [Alistipes sp.]|nr:glycosyltransferase [Alistipes sp.]